MLLRRTLLPFLLVVFAASAVSAQPVQTRRLVVIDQDADGPGDSSMESMLMLLNDPTVQVLGITIESGDGWNEESVAHTLRMLELVGSTDVPVFHGASFPLINSQAASRRWEQLYGHWGYKGAWTESWPSDNTVTRIAPHGPYVVPPLRDAGRYWSRCHVPHPHRARVPAPGLGRCARPRHQPFASLAKDHRLTRKRPSPPP